MTSLYQKIHALALKAQAHHWLQLKDRLHQTSANLTEINRTDCNQQDRWRDIDSLDMLVPHGTHDHSDIGRNLVYASDLSDNNDTNPIDKAISNQIYFSTPHFLFESHNKPDNNQDSTGNYIVMRSKDGREENVWTGPTLLSSSSGSSTEPESEIRPWPRTTEQVVQGCDWDKRLDEKIPRSHENEAHLTKVPQNVRLKGMARLRRLSPRFIKTAASQDTTDDSSRAYAIQVYNG